MIDIKATFINDVKAEGGECKKFNLSENSSPGALKFNFSVTSSMKRA